jgi:hypothetical protein
MLTLVHIVGWFLEQEKKSRSIVFIDFEAKNLYKMQNKIAHYINYALYEITHLQYMFLL